MYLISDEIPQIMYPISEDVICVSAMSSLLILRTDKCSLGNLLRSCERESSFIGRLHIKLIYIFLSTFVPNFGRFFFCHRNPDNGNVFVDFTFHPENIDIEL